MQIEKYWKKCNLSKKTYNSILKEIEEWEIYLAHEWNMSVEDLPETAYFEITYFIEEDGFNLDDIKYVMCNNK